MLIEEEHLRHITHLFYRGSYDQGITEISTFIQQNPGNSNLYTNRALFLAQLDNDEEALKDLRLALSINPRNYISYFNVFSIKVKLGLDQEAYQNLCCSLSCLYLLKAKSNKNLSDVNCSIYFSNNNFESHLLKGLILMERGNYIQAFTSIQSALAYNPMNKIILHLRRVVIKLIDADTRSHLKIKEQFLVNLDGNWRDFTLKSSIIIPQDENLQSKIEQRLVQFNQLYNEINNNIGAITHKMTNQNGQLHNSKHSHEQHVIVIRDSGVRTPKNQSQLYPQPGNVYIRTSNYSSQSFVSIKSNNIEEFHSIVNQNQEKKNLQDEQSQFSSVAQYKQHLQNNLQEFQDIIPQNNNQSQSVQQKLIEKQSFLSLESIIHQEKSQQQVINVVQENEKSQIEIKQAEKYNIIYPIDDNMKLKIKLQSIQFTQDSSVLNFQKMTNLYCIISYNNGKSKLKTQSKSYQNGMCLWNQQFTSIEISDQPSDMLIKLYNKKYNSIRDEFIGDLQVLITTANKLLLPMHNKKGEFIGQVLVQLELVQVNAVPNVQIQEEQQ